MLSAYGMNTGENTLHWIETSTSISTEISTFDDEKPKNKQVRRFRWPTVQLPNSVWMGEKKLEKSLDTSESTR